MRLGKTPPHREVAGSRLHHLLVRLDSPPPSPDAGIGVTESPIEHRVGAKPCFSPSDGRDGRGGAPLRRLQAPDQQLRLCGCRVGAIELGDPKGSLERPAGCAQMLLSVFEQRPALGEQPVEIGSGSTSVPGPAASPASHPRSCPRDLEAGLRHAGVEGDLTRCRGPCGEGLAPFGEVRFAGFALKGEGVLAVPNARIDSQGQPRARRYRDLVADDLSLMWPQRSIERRRGEAVHSVQELRVRRSIEDRRPQREHPLVVIA